MIIVISVILCVLLVYVYTSLNTEKYTNPKPHNLKYAIISTLEGMTIHDALVETGSTTLSELYSKLSEYGIYPLIHQDTITGFRPIYHPSDITGTHFDPLIQPVAQ